MPDLVGFRVGGNNIYVSSTALPLIRPLAMPVEHGAWSFLLEPIILGLIIAPSGDGVLITIGTVAVMLIRQPLKLMLRDWSRQRYPRTAVCEALVAAFGVGALLTFGVAFGPALLPLLIAIPFGVTQFIYDYRNQNRTLMSELCGAIASSAPVIAAIVIAGGKPAAIAAGLAALILARAIPAVLYVRAVLRGESRVVMLIAHAVAIAVAAIVSWFAVAAMVLLFVRALLPVRNVRAQKVGMREIAFGAAFVALAAIGSYV
jgi:hypothetical protein